MPKIYIDQSRCKKDGLCAAVCPMRVLAQDEKMAFPHAVHEELCISCGHCLAVCPQQAITHRDVSPERVRPIDEEHLPSAEGLHHLLRTRRSVRALKDVPVHKNVIEEIIQAARFAPSAHNAQSTEYLVVQDQAKLEQVVQWTTKYLRNLAFLMGNPVLQPVLSWSLRNTFENIPLIAKEAQLLVDGVAAGRETILHHAPALILFHARQNVVFAGENANLAAQNAALMAQSLGLGAFYTGYIVKACEDRNGLPKLLGIPKNHRVYAGLAIGYPVTQFRRWIEKEPAKVQWM